MSNTPLWYRFAWFLGRPPPLTAHQWKLLALVAAVSVFEQYDMYLFALNLKQIQADLAIPESDLGLLGAIVRAGSLFAVLFAIAADRYGRRRLLLITVLGYTILTGATALAPNAEVFVVCQFLARSFGTAELLIAAVVIAEEFAPEHRGWGIGALGALQACGAGLAALLFGFVDYLPYGWRSLYVVGLIPLLAIAYWRRTLPETRRFVEIERVQVPIIDSIRRLLTHSPKRTIGLFVAVFFMSIAGSSAGFFAPKYLQDVHGWTPAGVATLNLMGGALAIIGNPLAGYLSDRFGRKPITVVFLVLFSCAAIVFYSMTGVIVPLLWVVMIFGSMGSDVTTTSYATELFPTSYRSSANGFRSVVSTVAGIVGLTSVSALFVYVGSNWVAVVILCGLSFVAPLMVWLLLPETAGRTLEEISPEQNR